MQIAREVFLSRVYRIWFLSPKFLCNFKQTCASTKLVSGPGVGPQSPVKKVYGHEGGETMQIKKKRSDNKRNGHVKLFDTHSDLPTWKNWYPSNMNMWIFTTTFTTTFTIMFTTTFPTLLSLSFFGTFPGTGLPQSLSQSLPQFAICLHMSNKARGNISMVLFSVVSVAEEMQWRCFPHEPKTICVSSRLSLQGLVCKVFVSLN